MSCAIFHNHQYVPAEPNSTHLRAKNGVQTPGNLLTGHANAVFSIPLGRQIAEWMDQIPNEGLLFFRGMLGAEYLAVTGAAGLRDVLFSWAYDFEKTSAFRRYTRRFLAAGLVVQEGNAHKTRRKAVAPVFQPRNVALLKPLLSAKSQGLVQALRSMCEDDVPDKGCSAVVDICDWATRLTLPVSLASARISASSTAATCTPS